LKMRQGKGSGVFMRILTFTRADGRLDGSGHLAIPLDVIATNHNVQPDLPSDNGGGQIDLCPFKNGARRPGGARCFMNGRGFR
jgi:hypothetical protein